MCESRDWEYQVTGDLNTTFGHRHHLYSAALPCFYALHHLIPELIFFLHLTRDYGIIVCVNDLWAISSAGRASALQAECQQFDPVIAHQKARWCSGLTCRPVTAEIVSSNLIRVASAEVAQW